MRSLRSGARRVFRRHDGARGRTYDAHYRALAARLGPFDRLSRDYASSVAALYVDAVHSQRTLEEARRARAEGTGRRPSQAGINQLQKRAGLAWMSYDDGLKRLEAMTSACPPADPVAEFAAAANGRAGR
jgi:hypothetical protein